MAKKKLSYQLANSVIYNNDGNHVACIIVKINDDNTVNLRGFGEMGSDLHFHNVNYGEKNGEFFISE